MMRLKQRPFESVAENLLKLGTLTLDHFLHSPSVDPPAPDSSIFTNAPTVEPLHPVPSETTESKATMPTQIMLLHQVCSQTFGNLDPLKYEIISEGPQTSKACILTITRPNGTSRSYTTHADFSRKADARAAVASVAVEMGALDFIRDGAQDQGVIRKGLVLAPLDAPSMIEHEVSLERDVPRNPEDNEFVKQIEDCAREWRAGRVKPLWVELADHKLPGKRGCALRIQLSTHSVRVFSTAIEHDDYASAKIACAEEATKQDVIHFIKHGNGQTRPAELNPLLEPDEERDVPNSSSSAAVSLQNFFDSLPRPLPEPVEGKTLQEINAPSWLHGLTQAARGARIQLSFIWLLEPKYGLHGAVLRVESPDDCKTYMVDPGFPKRADAKIAVCLLAMSQGVGKYIRDLSEEVSNKISPEMRQTAIQSIIPLIASEYAKIWPEKCPDPYQFYRERDAIGCTLTLRLPSGETRFWKVMPEYRRNNEAKIAVATLAFAEGAIQFLRFRGEPAPPGYKVHLPGKTSKGGDSKNEPVGKKRRVPGEFDETVKNKRHKADPRSQPSRSTANPQNVKTSEHSRHGGGKGVWNKPNPAGPPPGHRVSSGPWNRDTRRPGWGARPDGLHHAQDSPYHSRYNVPAETFFDQRGSTYRSGPYDPRPPSDPHGPRSYAAAPPYPSLAPSSHPPPPPLYGDNHARRFNGSAPVSEPQRSERIWEPGPHASTIRSPVNDRESHNSKQRPVSSTSGSSSAASHVQKMPRLDHERGQPSASSSQLLNHSTPVPETSRSVASPSIPSTPSSRRAPSIPPQPLPSIAKQAVVSRPAVEPRATNTPSGASAVAGASTVEPSSANKISVPPTPPISSTNVATSSSKSTSAPPHVKTTSFKGALLEYCSKNKQPQPQFFSAEDRNPTDQTKQYKLWVVLGKEKMELPKAFPNIEEGQERLAKQILKRLHSQAQKPKIG